MQREILPRGYHLNCSAVINSLLIYIGLAVFAFVSGIMDNEKDFSEFLKFASAIAVFDTALLCFGLYSLKKGLDKRRERRWRMLHADFCASGTVLKVSEVLVNYKGDIITGSYFEHANCDIYYRMTVTYMHPVNGTEKTVESELYWKNPARFLGSSEVKVYSVRNAPLIIAVFAK